MKLRVLNSKNPTQRSDIRNLTQKIVNHLIRPGIAKNLNITVRIKDNNLDGCMGWCQPLDNHLPRRFEIVLSSRLNKRTLMQTLAHELVHVKQFAQDELKFLVNSVEPRQRWHNERFDENTTYWNQPWEKEARKMERPLLMKWARSQKLMKKSWLKMPKKG